MRAELGPGPARARARLRLPTLGLCGAMGLLLASCAAAPSAGAPERADRPWQAGGGTDGFVLKPNPALSTLPAPPALEPDHAYTLAELIALAQSSSPRTRIGWDEARNAALAVDAAAGSNLPRLSASVVGGTQRGSNQSSTLGLDFTGGDSASGTLASVSLQWLLYDFGARAALGDAAQAASQAANIGFTAAHQRLIHEVSLAYYAHDAARQRLASAIASLSNARAIEQAADARFAQGVGTVLEQAQARQASAQARLAQVQAEGALRDRYVALLTAMGVSPLTRLQLAAEAPRQLSSSLLPEVDRLVADSLARRPDLQAAYATQALSRARQRGAQAAYLPQIFVVGSASAGSGGLTMSAGALPGLPQLPSMQIGADRHQAGVLLGISIPLYDGGERDAAAARANNDADRAAAALAQTRDDAVLQIVSARNTLETSLAACEAAASLAGAAQISYDAAVDAYDHGVGTISAATAAQTQLLLAQEAVADANHQARAAAATLAFATGTLGSAPR